MASKNLISAENVSISFGADSPVLNGVSLGINADDRIGVVGRNGGGKSTLMSVLAMRQTPDSGRVAQAGGLRVGFLDQADARADVSVREHLFADRPSHDWLGDARTREVLRRLWHGAEEELLQQRLTQLSGGERRRVELAKLLLADLDVLMLDEPTNHLDVEAVAWLAEELNRRRDLAIIVVTHDRWFLDAVAQETWEVHDGVVDVYEGGYSAYILARAERMRQADAAEARRRNLLRKELAWLRRGPPARTSKPKFRIDAANELIESEPAPRDTAALLRFASNRLGKTVIECVNVDYQIGHCTVATDLTWQLGPGDRIGIVGVNGAGKSSFMDLLAGVREPDHGRIRHGMTVVLAYLTQQLEQLDESRRVLQSVEDIANRITLAGGRELSAASVCERLGFPPDRQWTPVADLSGGERRRLQLTRLLMTEPNVLFLDEPTNDFDTDTLAELEDLLDSFGGTLVVISHDRYFLERVCDSTYGLFGDGKLRHLPGGIEEYLDTRANRHMLSSKTASKPVSGKVDASKSASAAEELRAAKKELAKIERQLTKCHDRISTIHIRMSEVATDMQAMSELADKLNTEEAQLSALEVRWLELAELTENGERAK